MSVGSSSTMDWQVVTTSMPDPVPKEAPATNVEDQKHAQVVVVSEVSGVQPGGGGPVRSDNVEQAQLEAAMIESSLAAAQESRMAVSVSEVPGVSGVSGVSESSGAAGYPEALVPLQAQVGDICAMV